MRAAATTLHFPKLATSHLRHHRRYSALYLCYFLHRINHPPSATTSILLCGSPPHSAVFSIIRSSAMSTTSSSSDTSTSESCVAEFALSNSCSMKIQKGDITKWFVDGSSDAIVNAANERMLGGGGVDGAIHRAAGPELRGACYDVPLVHPGVRCPTGEARITPGFRLPASHVIHTVGPIYDEDENPEALLESAYRNTLTVAKENNIQFVSFPAISCGVYGYPFNEAASVAISTVKEFANDFKEVHFVLFAEDIYDAWLEKAKEIVEEEAKEAKEIVGVEAKEIVNEEAKEIVNEEAKEFVDKGEKEIVDKEGLLRST